MVKEQQREEICTFLSQNGEPSIENKTIGSSMAGGWQIGLEHTPRFVILKWNETWYACVMPKKFKCSALKKLAMSKVMITI